MGSGSAHEGMIFRILNQFGHTPTSGQTRDLEPGHGPGDLILGQGTTLYFVDPEKVLGNVAEGPQGTWSYSHFPTGMEVLQYFNH